MTTEIEPVIPTMPDDDTEITVRADGAGKRYDYSEREAALVPDLR
ncbi:MAG: hypothetical protein PPP58_10405 [Natronomonas sp.]